MSNHLAIAAVTATLRNILTERLSGFSQLAVNTLPLDKAGDGDSSGQYILNLFLYQATSNAAWRNMDAPGRAKPGETSSPPLALELYFLMTAWAPSQTAATDYGIEAQRLLGNAMLVLHDYPVLGLNEIKTALPDNDLYTQVERVRLTPHGLSLEDISKLWTAFQKPYRTSVAYMASVVLLDSTRPVKASLPVLMIGAGGSGIVAQAGVLPPFPTLETVEPPNRQLSIRLGETLTLSGVHLDGEAVRVRFQCARWDTPIDLPVMAPRSPTRVQVRLPDDATARSSWPIGPYTVSTVVTVGEKVRVSNQLPVTLAPAISIAPDSIELSGEPVTLTVSCVPDVLSSQRASLLLGAREIEAEAHDAPTDSLEFVVTDPTPGTFYVRMRVDGIDTILIDRTASPPAYYASQKVTFTGGEG